MNRIRTTMQPYQVIEVDDAELRGLSLQGLVHEIVADEDPKPSETVPETQTDGAIETPENKEK